MSREIAMAELARRPWEPIAVVLQSGEPALAVNIGLPGHAIVGRDMPGGLYSLALTATGSDEDIAALDPTEATLLQYIGVLP